MKSVFVASALALAIGGGVVVEALAQANPNQLVANRKGAMALQGKYFGPMLAMVQDRSPYDPAIIQRNSEYLSVLAKLPWDDFQPSTIGNANSKAKEDVFKDAAKFKAGVDAFQAEVQKLSVAARAGDRAAVGQAVRSTGQACNSCHESFSTMEWRFRLP